MIISLTPIILADVCGSMLMIFLAASCVYQVSNLNARDTGNVIWTYLNCLVFAIAGFTMVRSTGILVIQVMELTEYHRGTEFVRPLSGSINNLILIAVGSVALFFERSWKIEERISKDKQALLSAHQEAAFSQRRLEKRVAERTESLAMSAHKYRRMFLDSGDMILVTMNDGTILDINPAGLKMLGFQSSKTMPEGEKFQSFFGNLRDWQRLKKNIQDLKIAESEEFTLKCRNGFNRRVLISSWMDKGDNSTSDTICFMVKDIERHKLMEQRNAQADNLASMGRFSSGIAHEINNPLGIILGYTQLLIRGENPESEKYKDLKIIEKHVRTCRSIVEDLLNFARSSKPAQDVVELNGLVEDAVLYVEGSATLDHDNIIRHYDHTLPPMILDETKIRQVVVNLIMNAGHAVAEKGKVFISTRYCPDDHQAVVVVADTGYGIEQKDVPHIFDPFFTTKPTGEGTGLGLAVCYGIIKNHGGDIVVQSKPGKGTEFTVTLPVNAYSP